MSSQLDFDIFSVAQYIWDFWILFSEKIWHDTCEYSDIELIFFFKFRHQIFKMKWWITVSVLTLSVCLTVCWADLTICERNPIHTTAEKSKGDNGFQISFQELDSKKNEKFKPGQNYTGNMPHFVRSFKYASQTGYFKFSWSILMIVYIYPWQMIGINYKKCHQDFAKAIENSYIGHLLRALRVVWRS